jgi:hypothetical protein
MSRGRMQFLLAVALQRSQRQSGIRRRLDLRQERCVADSPRSTIGVADGGSDVTTDLCATECAWSAAAWSLLQRLRGAVPAVMPLGQAPRSSLDLVTSGERFEAATPRTRRVLEKDVMLGFGA